MELSILKRLRYQSKWRVKLLLLIEILDLIYEALSIALPGNFDIIAVSPDLSLDSEVHLRVFLMLNNEYVLATFSLHDLTVFRVIKVLRENWWLWLFSADR